MSIPLQARRTPAAAATPLVAIALGLAIMTPSLAQKPTLDGQRSLVIAHRGASGCLPSTRSKPTPGDWVAFKIRAQSSGLIAEGPRVNEQTQLVLILDQAA
jgi:hypothetical protein